MKQGSLTAPLQKQSRGFLILGVTRRLKILLTSVSFLRDRSTGVVHLTRMPYSAGCGAQPDAPRQSQSLDLRSRGDRRT